LSHTLPHNVACLRRKYVHMDVDMDADWGTQTKTTTGKETI